MFIFMFIFFTIIFLIILFLKLNSNELKKLFTIIFILIFFVCLIIFSSSAIKSGLRGIRLWLDIVLPSLLPFFVIIEIINKTGLVKLMGAILEPIMRPIFNLPGCSSLAFVAGTLGGFPMGAKIASDLKKNNLITEIEAERLISFTNNSGPIFIIGAIGSEMLKMRDIGIFLLICHIAAAITVGVLFRFYKYKKLKESKNWKQVIKKIKLEWTSLNFTNIGEVLGESIKSSMLVLISVGGFIIVFSVIISILINTNLILIISQFFSNIFSISSYSIESILCGIIELTTGSYSIAKSNILLAEKLLILSFLIGWSGISIHMQVISILSLNKIKSYTYILGKGLQAIIAIFYCFVGIFIFPLIPQNVFTILQPPISNNYIAIAGSLIFISIMLVFSIIILKHILKRLCKFAKSFI